MSKRPSFKSFKKLALQDQDFKKEYELLQPEFEILHQFITARKKARISQLKLAQRLEMQQPAVARLEMGGYTTTSISKLAKVADALGYSFKVALEPKNKSKKIAKKKP